MKQILGDSGQRLQFGFHLAALGLLAAAAAWPAALAYPAALALGASGVLLGANLLKALRAFRRFTRTRAEDDGAGGRKRSSAYATF